MNGRASGMIGAGSKRWGETRKSLIDRSLVGRRLRGETRICGRASAKRGTMCMNHRMNGVGAEQEGMGILGRKDFLKLAGAAGLGAAAGTGLLQAGAGAAVSTDLDPE